LQHWPQGRGAVKPLNQLLLLWLTVLEVPIPRSLLPEIEIWPGLVEPVEVGLGVEMWVLPAGAKTLKWTHTRTVGS